MSSPRGETTAWIMAPAVVDVSARAVADEDAEEGLRVSAE